MKIDQLIHLTSFYYEKTNLFMNTTNIRLATRRGTSQTYGNHYTSNLCYDNATYIDTTVKISS